MPRAVLEFNLPEDDEEHRLALNGSRWNSIVVDMDQWLHSRIKYGESETLKAVEVRAQLREFIADAGVELD